LVHGDGGLYDSLNRYGFRFAIVWLVALAGLLGWRLVRSSRALLAVRAPVPLAALTYLTLAGIDFGHSMGRNFLSNDATAVRLWRLEAAALVVLSVAAGWTLVRERRARVSVARLVVELGHARRAGGVRDAVASALRDPSLTLAYRRPQSDTYV